MEPNRDLCVAHALHGGAPPGKSQGGPAQGVARRHSICISAYVCSYNMLFLFRAFSSMTWGVGFGPSLLGVACWLSLFTLLRVEFKSLRTRSAHRTKDSLGYYPVSE